MRIGSPPYIYSTHVHARSQHDRTKSSHQVKLTATTNTYVNMVTLANLRSMCGHIVERATLARDLLAPAASRLSGDDPAGGGGGLHSRCVLAQRLGWSFFPQTDDVRADLEPFGAIEAIALCETAAAAVVVFRDEASVAVTLRRQEETSAGLYSAVPPPYLALPLRFIRPDRIQV